MTPGSSLLSVRGCAVILSGKQRFVAFQSLRCFGPSTARQKERESAWRWSLGSQKDLWCGPSFSLDWDKPGSVAPLRLVGCLIETPAPSWAYFYSIFSLPFFLLPYSDPSCSFFVNYPLSPSISLPLSSSSMVLGCVSACMHDRGKWKKNYTARFLVWIPIFTCFFPRFLSFCIYFTQSLAKMARAPCHWFGSIHAVYIFRAL